MTINVHFTPDDWERIERDWSAWWAGELDRPLVMLTREDPPADPARPYLTRYTAYYGLATPVDDLLDGYQAQLEATRWYGDAWPKWWPNYGPGIVAGFLGARLDAVWDTVWFTPAQITPIGELRLHFDAGNPWRRRVQELTRRAVERWRGQVAVAYTDLGGNLDILASLRTTQGLLFDLHDAPGQVERLTREITPLWLRYYEELDAIIRPAGRGTNPWAAIWSPRRCYMLQSDFAYMISPRMFERFVLPDLAACCDALDDGFYHLDGKGQIPHLEMLLSLPRLRGIQWIPCDGASPPEEWLPLLKRIRDAGKLCQLYVSPEGALKIVQAFGGKGFALCIKDEYVTEMSQAEIRDFLETMRKAG